MKLWEYKKIDVIHAKLEETLNVEGNDGWDLCGSTFLGKTWSIILKRPKIDVHAE